MRKLSPVAVRIAAGYAAAGGLWILVSDLVLEHSGVMPVWGQILSGWLFVAVSTGLVAALVHRAWTREQRLERELEETHRMEALGRLAGGIAQDFGDVLVAIEEFARRARSRLGEGELREEDLGRVIAAGERASSLLRQLLVFSRSAAEPERTECDVTATVRELESVVAALVEERVALFVRTPRQPLRVAARRSEIERIVLNLATNASDAMPGGGSLEIAVQALEVQSARRIGGSSLGPGPYVVLSVSDSGFGMDAAVRRHLFEPFFTTKVRGTGLGLSTVYALTRQRGGGIEVHSEPGTGTRFNLYLPRLERAAAGVPADAASPADKPVAEGRPARVGTVLLAEGDRDVRRLARTTLEESGWRVVEARDGLEALEIVRSGRPVDLLVADVVLPGAGGRAVAEELRARSPDAAALLITETRAETGGDEEGWLGRRFTPTELIEAVAGVLRAGGGSE